MLETIRLGIVQAEGNAQYVAVRGTMLRLAHMPGDVAYVVAMSMMRVTVRKGNETVYGRGKILSEALT